MRTIAVVQARAGSSRLPGKIALPLGERSVLGWVVRAAQESGVCDEVVVATTVSPADDVTAVDAAGMGAQVVRGDEDDVLSRFIAALDAHPASAVVRLTADCPLLDPAVIAASVRALLSLMPRVEYLSTVLQRSLPRGLDVEVITAEALGRLGAEATGVHRTHVTSGAYARGSTFRRCGLLFEPRSDDLRVTLDTEDDYRALCRLVDVLGDGPHPYGQVVQALRGRPDIIALNAHVKQKPLEAG